MKATRSVLFRAFLLTMVSTLLAGGALAQGGQSSTTDVEGWWSWVAPSDEGGDHARARAADEDDETRPRRRPRTDRRNDPDDVDRRRGDRGRGSHRGERAPKQRRGDRQHERSERAKGPPFCRTGAGHPVFGMEWCYEHGFGRAGYEQRRGDWRYEQGRTRRHPERSQSDWHWERRSDLEDILLGKPRSGQFSQRAGNSMFSGLLDRVLGRPLDRLLARFGEQAPVEGRWIVLSSRIRTVIGTRGKEGLLGSHDVWSRPGGGTARRIASLALRTAPSRAMPASAPKRSGAPAT